MSDINIERDDDGKVIGITFDESFLVECGEDGITSLPNITIIESDGGKKEVI